MSLPKNHRPIMGNKSYFSTAFVLEYLGKQTPLPGANAAATAAWFERYLREAEPGWKIPERRRARQEHVV